MIQFSWAVFFFLENNHAVNVILSRNKKLWFSNTILAMSLARKVTILWDALVNSPAEKHVRMSKNIVVKSNNQRYKQCVLINNQQSAVFVISCFNNQLFKFNGFKRRTQIVYTPPAKMKNPRWDVPK